MATVFYSPRSAPGQKPPSGAPCNYAHPLKPMFGYALLERSGGQIQDLVAQRYDTGFVNNPTWTRDAGLHFVNASSQYIPLNTRKFLCNGGLDAFTLGILLRWTTTTGNLFTYTEGNSGTNNTIVSIANDGGDARLARFFVRGDSGGARIDMSSTTALDDGRWHAIFGVSYGDVANARLYVDSKLQASAGTSNAGQAVTPNLRTLGALGRTAYGNYWDGDIGYVFGWNRALTAAQVASLSVNPFQWLHRPKWFVAGVTPPISSGTNDVIYPGRNARCGRSIISHW